MGMMLLQMNDTEKEGDGNRAIVNSKLLLLMFRSTSRSKKYAFEMLRLISKVKCQMTERMAARTIHGRFVSWKGNLIFKFVIAHGPYACWQKCCFIIKTTHYICCPRKYMHTWSKVIWNPRPTENSCLTSCFPLKILDSAFPPGCVFFRKRFKKSVFDKRFSVQNGAQQLPYMMF